MGFRLRLPWVWFRATSVPFQFVGLLAGMIANFVEVRINSGCLCTQIVFHETLLCLTGLVPTKENAALPKVEYE